MNQFFDQYISSSFMNSLMNFLIALVVLIVGWIIAKAIGKAVEKALSKTNWDEKLFQRFQPSADRKSPEDDKKWNTNEIIGKVVYYFLLLIVIILFLNMLNLSILAGPLSNLVSTLLAVIPAILKAALLLAVAWIIATVVQWLITDGSRRLNLTKFFHKIRLAKSEEDVQHYMQTIGKVAFYLILLLFLPAILNALNISGIAEPFTGLLNAMLAFIPNLIAAIVIFAVGWFVAKVTKSIVTNLMQSLGSERLVSRLRLTKVFEGTSLASVTGNLIFILILIPVTIAALEQLQLRGITEPAIGMLNKAFSMIPNLLVASFLILAGVWLGKLIGGFVSSFLSNLGFNRITEQMDMKERSVSDKLSPARLVGYIVQVLIVFFMTIQALHVLELNFLVSIAGAITAYLPMVLAAVLTLGVALILANITEKILKNVLTGPASRTLALFAKVAILTVAVFMALTQLGIAPSIVNAAFILILGGLSLAFGLAFGLGGKDFAAKYLRKFDQTISSTSIREDENPLDEKPNPDNRNR